MSNWPIDQIEIINFQGHKYTLLDFSSGLNIIKGRTHSGKSSIVRAVEWAAENRPRGAGDKYRNDDAKLADEVSVSIAFGEGSFISRQKNRTINGYITSEHKEPFVALRTDVPDEIREITKLRSHNILTQKDKYFLIDKTPGQVSSELNKVVGLKIIDEKASKAKTIVKHLSNKITLLGEQIEGTEKELESVEFKTAERLRLKLAKIDELIDTFDSDEAELAYLLEIKDNISEHELNIKSYNSVEHILPAIGVLKRLIEESDKKEEEISGAVYIRTMIESWEADEDQANAIIALEPKVSEVKKLINDYNFINNAVLDVMDISSMIKNTEVIISSLSNQIDKSDKKLKELESQLEYCTKCGALRKHWREV